MSNIVLPDFLKRIDFSRLFSYNPIFDSSEKIKSL